MKQDQKLVQLKIKHLDGANLEPMVVLLCVNLQQCSMSCMILELKTAPPFIPIEKAKEKARGEVADDEMRGEEIEALMRKFIIATFLWNNKILVVIHFLPSLLFLQIENLQSCFILEQIVIEEQEIVLANRN